MKRSLILVLLLTACSQQATTTTNSTVVDETSTTVAVSESSTTAGTPITTTADGPASTTSDDATTTTSIDDNSATTGFDEDDTPTTTSSSTTTTPGSPSGPALVVASYEPVLGVPIGTDFDTASVDLEAVLGEPDQDTGWTVGCPLDGEEENERSLFWGSLRVDFYLTNVGRLSAWVYDTSQGEDRPEGIARLQLPGDVSLGQPMADVADRIGADLTLDGVFDAATTGEDGYVLWGFPASADAPLTIIGVPYVPVCE